jgi:hypothetical protein
MRLKDAVTGQLDQGFPWFSSVLGYPKSMLHCMHLMLPSKELTSTFFSKHSRPNVIEISSQCCALKPKVSASTQVLSHSAFSQQSLSHHAIFFTSQCLTFLKLPHQKEKQALPGNLQSSKVLSSP